MKKMCIILKLSKSEFYVPYPTVFMTFFTRLQISRKTSQIFKKSLSLNTQKEANRMVYKLKNDSQLIFRIPLLLRHPQHDELRPNLCLSRLVFQFHFSWHFHAISYSKNVCGNVGFSKSRTKISYWYRVYAIFRSSGYVVKHFSFSQFWQLLFETENFSGD